MIKNKIDLGVIQETLLIPLWARATELEQVDPILVDSKSAEIVAALDYDFEKFAHAKNSQIGACLRGMIIDNWTRNFLQQHPQSSVVEIGAGLNTRFERVDNNQVRWFDLDLPDVMALRKQFFQETERRQFITASCLDTDWFERIKAAGTQPCMFIAEGVLMYLNERQVRQLFSNLLQEFPGSWFAFDSISPLFVKNQKYHDAIKHVSAKFDWGISDIREIKNWDSRYHIMEVCTFKDLPAQYLKRFSLLNRLLFSYIPPLRNTYRLALVKLG
ncbi:class I SAM-dependent methyltransferase [Chlorogloeopsis fritschii PCC 9212]|uniref:Tetracenomycin C synthesis protein n=1 Tax=Chlorogloeopsis fritschii PCC 6912 TaxID=211165 RepID=A0A433NPU8_CHLFR|nr:class I SAM-dependent methyltransferase [Chlorogloeopsis fritschii]RUR85842.1 tetracenomycin C synthesis protein [Chlorogloeopsis fritschii PCC 6912]